MMEIGNEQLKRSLESQLKYEESRQRFYTSLREIAGKSAEELVRKAEYLYQQRNSPLYIPGSKKCCRP